MHMHFSSSLDTSKKLTLSEKYNIQQQKTFTRMLNVNHKQQREIKRENIVENKKSFRKNIFDLIGSNKKNKKEEAPYSRCF